jgi:hypothetical protein
MGDMADMLIEQGFANLFDGIEDAVSGEPFTRACKYCDERDLHWRHLAEGWRLFNYEGVIHSCKEYR